MPQDFRGRPVVVGVDASQAALRATRFAAEVRTDLVQTCVVQGDPVEALQRESILASAQAPSGRG